MNLLVYVAVYWVYHSWVHNRYEPEDVNISFTALNISNPGSAICVSLLHHLHEPAVFITSYSCALNTFSLQHSRHSWAGYLSQYSDWLRAGRSGDRIPVGEKFSAPVQTGPGAHPASCTMGTGSFPGVKSGRSVTLTPHPLLVPLVMKE